MFYGGILKAGVELKPSSEEGEILHLSSACAVSVEDGSCQLIVETEDNQKYTAAVLSKSNPQASIDLFLRARDNVKLRMKGKGEIHVVGYWEPDADESHADCEGRGAMMGLRDVEEEESEEEEEQVMVPKKDAKKQPESKKAKQLAGKQIAKQQVVLEDAEEDDEEDQDEEEDEDNEEGSEEDDDNLSEAEIESDDDDEEDDDIKEEEEEETDAEEENPMFQQLKQKLDKTKGKAPPTPATAVPKKDNKRKGAEAPKTPQAAKKAKTAATGSSNNGEDAMKFEKDLESYLKAHGRTQLSTLGSQVKRPSTVDKLGLFMRERSSKFAVENGYVSLIK